MINLLPPDLKQEYRYARRNTTLLRYVTLSGLGLAGLAIICVLGVIYLQQTTKSYVAQADIIKASLVNQRQPEIEREVKDISGSLRLAVQVLSQEVLFSKLLKQIAIITPSNANLSALNISQVQGSIDITAKTTDYNAATQLHVNLADPDNKIFAKADIVSITCGTGETVGATKYPCTVTIRALFAKDNPFLFINNSGAKS